MAGGDLSRSFEPKSDKDVLGHAFTEMIASWRTGGQARVILRQHRLRLPHRSQQASEDLSPKTHHRPGVRLKRTAFQHGGG